MDEATQQRAEQPVVSIVGDKVALGPPHRGMLPLLLVWANDLGLSLLSGDPLRPQTRDAVEADYERYAKEKPPDMVIFAIYERATLRLIGVTDLHRIDLSERTAEFGIGIGERDYHGKGYGTETTALMLDYAFTALGLHNVMLDTFAYNERAIRAYTRAGFRPIGRRRQAHRVGHQAYDLVLMDCLATEFSSPFPPVLKLPS